jgi:hypothetical protein
MAAALDGAAFSPVPVLSFMKTFISRAIPFTTPNASLLGPHFGLDIVTSDAV